VAGDTGDLTAAAELFELFKTPWQPVRSGTRYRVILDGAGFGAEGGAADGVEADVRLVFGVAERPIDRRFNIAVESRPGLVVGEWASQTLPIYGGVATFDVSEPLLTAEGRPIGYMKRDGDSIVYRLGYDLFAEVRHLLSDGQPVAHALTPTLELHIAILRQTLIDAGVPVLEVLPRPYGYDFICCLTHDIDFFGIRRHQFDLTLAGFIARASVGTLFDLVRGRRSMIEAVRNWGALASLPLVFLRLAPDFWRPLHDYARLEKDGAQSTFFFVPFKGRPGLSPGGVVAPRRAVPYEAADVEDDIRDAVKRGSEIAVHGIDAWRDADAGNAERQKLAAISGQQTAGVRMHWLYFDRDAPRQIEAAGFDYDSTCGFNNAVGYRAGTSQVFRLPGTVQLMELPLSIMDSALFYRHRMNLAPDDALDLCRQIVSNARRFGGTVVINWHDRSLAPERLWGRSYERLLAAVRVHRAWFATAGRAVDWFRWRRSIRFVEEADSQRVTIVSSNAGTVLPPSVVRIHRPARASSPTVEDRLFHGHGPMSVTL